jgi:hypothetical protein
MRFEGWEVRLNAALDKHSRRPHDWGRDDCMIFVADCVWALTQKDAAEPWRRTYSDEAGALALVEAHGGFPKLVETALTRAGIAFEHIPPSFAQRGDPCFLDISRHFTPEALALNPLADLGAVGICVGAEVALKTFTGLERRPLGWATTAWAIR